MKQLPTNSFLTISANKSLALLIYGLFKKNFRLTENHFISTVAARDIFGITGELALPQRRVQGQSGSK